MTTARPTRKERVLNLLKHPESQDGWVPGHLVASARIGGEAGLVRLRELRRAGYPIEYRQRDHSDGCEYRLTPCGLCGYPHLPTDAPRNHAFLRPLDSA